ncbi:lysophospholipase [Oscillospiraceae bacterium PP1C4]
MKQQSMISSFDGAQLFLRKDIPDNCKAIAVIVHGLCEHHGRYDYLVDKFCLKGVGCYRFDHRGHGRSEGERTFYSDWNQLPDDTNIVVELAKKEYPDLPVFLVGHSMGGYTVALYGCKYPDKVKGIVMSGALTHDHRRLIADIPTNLDPHTQLPNELGDGVCSVKAVVDDYVADPYNTKTFTAGLCFALNEGVTWLTEHLSTFTYPVLLLHGEKDALVDVQDTFDSFKTVASSDRQMKVYGGLYHEIFNEYCRDEVIEDALSWIINRI